MNILYYGDNLDILKRYIASDSVDLIYLDPPFNSNVDYNVLFTEKNGSDAASQIRAFTDTWQWDQCAALSYKRTVEAGGRISETLQSLHGLLGESDMMAYLSMMAPRLVELRRVLKNTGALYLHCDPTASHYLKILLDGVFSPAGFRSEIIWKRTSGHYSAKRWGPAHDVLLFYTKTDRFRWNAVYQPYDEEYLGSFYRYEDEGGRYRIGDLTGAGVRTGNSGKPWRGCNPTKKNRHWAVPTKVLEIVKKQIPDRDIDEL
ncbi:MAG TPA: DNA methyltransferase, partial [bacterium]|nr:DNA methyltransferase [bacterium]